MQTEVVKCEYKLYFRYMTEIHIEPLCYHGMVCLQVTDGDSLDVEISSEYIE
jgi:hypothetical protein